MGGRSRLWLPLVIGVGTVGCLVCVLQEKIARCSSEVHLSQAEACQRAGRLTEALEECTRAITCRPANGAAYANRGVVRRRLGDLEGAVSDATEAIGLGPESVRSLAYYNRANAYAEAGDLDRAIADYTVAAEMRPNDASVAYNCGNTYYKRGDKEEAIAQYTRVLALDPGRAIAYYNRGKAYADLGDLARAVEDYTRSLAIRPSANAYYNRGRVYLRSDSPGKAVADFSRAIELGLDDDDTHYNRALSYMELGELRLAVDDLTTAIALNPKAAVLYDTRADCWDLGSDAEAAARDREIAKRLKPTENTDGNGALEDDREVTLDAE